MKKTAKYSVAIIGTCLIFCLLAANIFFSSELTNDVAEHITIKNNNFVYIIITIILVMGIVSFIKFAEKIYGHIKKNKIVNICAISIICIIYFVLQICWINYKNLKPNSDQLYTRDLSLSMYAGDDDKYKNSVYFELYPQQITLANAWNVFYKITHRNSVKIVQYGNAILNVGSLLLIYFITKKINKDFSEGIGGFLLYLLFIPISMLCTFVYGDIPGLFFCLSAILFIIKFNESNRIFYFGISALSMALAYYLRMNNLIVLIAITLYMLLKVLEKSLGMKKRTIKLGLIILYILITILPSKVVIKIYENKYELDKEASFSIHGFLCMGMHESTRAPGWYDDDYGQYSFDDAKKAKEIYENDIKDRIHYYKENPLDFMKFYAKKIIAMWAENTYQCVWYNIGFLDKTDENLEKNEKMYKYKNDIQILSKGITCAIALFSIYVIIKRKLNLTDEELLLVMLFCGGFMFHLLWEAKSRYIITYIIYLIPVAVTGISCIKSQKNESV